MSVFVKDGAICVVSKQGLYLVTLITDKGVTHMVFLNVKDLAWFLEDWRRVEHTA